MPATATVATSSSCRFWKTRLILCSNHPYTFGKKEDSEAKYQNFKRATITMHWFGSPKLLLCFTLAALCQLAMGRLAVMSIDLGGEYMKIAIVTVTDLMSLFLQVGWLSCPLTWEEST
ncbi:hypothetical protein ACOMHN_044210 [Nucella lapillus]